MMITRAVLKPCLTISNPRDEERAVRILEKAERHCLIANSDKTTIELDPQVRIVDAGVAT